MDVTAASPGLYQRASDTTLHLRASLPQALHNPKVAIVCGSGLGGLADTINAEPRIEKAYADVPNFPVSTGRLCSVSRNCMHEENVLLMKSLGNSARPCGQARLRHHWDGEDTRSTTGRKSAVSDSLPCCIWLPFAYEYFTHYMTKFLRRPYHGTRHVRNTSMQTARYRDYDRCVDSATYV
jgi:hypothetical protein